MRPFLVKPATSLKGEIDLLGDKSIACRSIIISSLACGETTIKNFPANKDCLYAINVFKNLGVKITVRPLEHKIIISGRGLYGLKKPEKTISAGDSGTTFRLALGVLAGQNFKVKLSAGKSLSQRPMRRATEPLRKMGAIIHSILNTLRHKDWRIRQELWREYSIPEEYPPITIQGGKLKAITYKMPVASAQVKSAILLAGLYADGQTCVIEPVLTRDHTERMLRLFKADLKMQKNRISVNGGRHLVSPGEIYIPGDISSASFFIVLAAILPDTQIKIRNVSLNPSRAGIVKVLKRMKAKIKVARSEGQKVRRFEPLGDIVSQTSKLKGTIIKKDEIPSLIDEIPILMVAASFAEGKTVFKGAEELRVKETDRINSMVTNLKAMGIRIEVLKDGASEDIVVYGAGKLIGAKVKSFNDHRTAMSMIIAGLGAKGRTLVDDIACIDKSFPEFLSLLKSLTVNSIFDRIN